MTLIIKIGDIMDIKDIKDMNMYDGAGAGTEDEKKIYSGPRNNNFRKIIYDLLKRGKLKDHYIKLLMTPDSMKIYNDVFTSNTADPINNYEVYEQLGDVMAGSFIVWYMYRRFPQLMCAEAVKIVARLKINYGAKETFWVFADKLGFWEFITATEEERMRERKDLLEDVFEAFIGATAFILDNNIKQGVGYAIVYDILATIFDGIEISLKYEDLYDAKTRLKELVDFFKDAIGTINFEYTRNPPNEAGHVFATSIIYRTFNGKKEEIGRGVAAKKQDSEQKAAEKAVEYLARLGFAKQISKLYLNQNIVPQSITPAPHPHPPPVSNYKKRMCNQWMNGQCFRGDKCNFAHGPEELRK